MQLHYLVHFTKTQLRPARSMLESDIKLPGYSYAAKLNLAIKSVCSH